MNNRKIIIVGGGSAAWMTAATMVKAFDNCEIIVYESPKEPTIGVGESTLGQIRVWTDFLEIDEKDFMKHCDASYKLSIKFTDFYKKDYGSFHYPFGIPYIIPNNDSGLNDWNVKKAFYPDTDLNDYTKTFFPIMSCVENNKISFNKKGRLPAYRFDTDSAFHFDASLFADWLKDNYCIPRGVKHYYKTVNSVNMNEDGIESLSFDDGSTDSAYLYIDCTGFKSLLIGEALKEEFIDFSHILPNNRAWATRIPYTDKELELEPFTNCTAIENGWVWNIPSWNRIGTGYVYSDRYASPEQALKEFKNYLRSEKMTVPNANRDVESFEYRDIRFRTGIHKRTFVKNVVAIGLSAAFIEPLESNGLFSVHEFLRKLVKVLGRDEISQFDRDTYNSVVKNMYLSFMEFVVSHYSLSHRDDTDYWRDISKKTFKDTDTYQYIESHGGLMDLITRRMELNRYDENSGTHCIATGLNYFPVDRNTVKEWSLWNKKDYKKIIDDLQRYWDANQKLWEEESAECQTVYQYLKENIHVDDK